MSILEMFQPALEIFNYAAADARKRVAALDTMIRAFFYENPQLLMPALFGVALLVIIAICVIFIRGQRPEEQVIAETQKSKPQEPSQQNQNTTFPSAPFHITFISIRIEPLDINIVSKAEAGIMMEDFFEIMKSAAEKTGGTVEVLADAAFAMHWGADGVLDISAPRGHVPHSPAHDALNAARSALLVRSALVDLNKIRVSRGERRITMLAGISSGRAMRSSLNYSGFFAGEPAVLAVNAREAAWLNLIDIVISARTWRLIKNYVVFEELKPLPHFKGTVPVRLFSLVQLRAMPPAPQPAPLTIAQLRALLKGDEAWQS